METDYRKYFENQGPQQIVVSSAEVGNNSTGALQAAVAGAAPAAVQDDPRAVTFPFHWPIRLILYGAVAGAFGFVAYTAFTGDPEKDLWTILLGCAGVLAGLAFLPGSIVVDSRGVHQVYLMGLYEYSIAKNAIRSYRVASTAELRREGKIRFQWRHERGDLEDEFEKVVYVASRYGNRYIMHTKSHRGRYSFMEELEKRGVPAHGYEEWDKFMTDRGFPPSEVKY